MDRRRNLFLQQSQNILIFSTYTDACTTSCKIVVASKRPLISLSSQLNILNVPQIVSMRRPAMIDAEFCIITHFHIVHTVSIYF